MTFGQLIQARRLALGLNQRELAARAGVSPMTIYHLERDTTAQPRYDTVVRVCRAIGLTLTEVLAVMRVRDDRDDA